jgi:hypothetical protein
VDVGLETVDSVDSRDDQAATLDEDVGALERELTKDDPSQIAKELSGFDVTGERLHQAVLKMTNR